VFNSYEERRRYKEEYQRKIKTELCKNWQLKGCCKYGNNVNFLNLFEQLRIVYKVFFCTWQRRIERKKTFAHQLQDQTLSTVFYERVLLLWI